MIVQLRKKLVAAYVFATGLLLTIIVAGLLLFSLKQYEANNVDRYRSAFENVVDTIKSSNRISHTWLAESEAGENLILSVSSNQTRLSFQGAWEPPTQRELLLEKLKYFAEKDGFFEKMSLMRQGEAQSPVYSVYGERGDHYYGSIFLKKAYGKEQEIMVLKALTDEKEVTLRLVLLYASINMTGLVILIFICNTFVRHSLKPLETGLKRQSEFIAAASHELRAPLTVIRAGILAFSTDEEKAKQFLPTLEKEGERMTALIDDLIKLALADARTWTMNKEPLVPDTFLISVFDSLTELCRKKNQRFELKLPDEELPVFMADRGRMEQVMVILVDNASSYSPEGSTITVSAKSLNRHIFIEVEDHGCGVRDEDKKRIFDRFYRSDKSRNDKAHHGLGLSIAMELVTLHQGKLSVKDTPGGGSTFVLEIPAGNAKK